MIFSKLFVLVATLGVLFPSKVNVVDASSDDESGVVFDVVDTDICTDVWAGSLADYPWLIPPKSAGVLATDEPLNFLAGRLIFHGLVDASGCQDGGMLTNGNASPCGLVAARELVREWQNRFDDQIFSSGLESGIPARLLKATIAQESQFWASQYVTGHFGLGHLTLNGADVALLWSPYLYQEICPHVFGSGYCSSDIGYASRDAVEQEMLKATLLVLVNPTCPNCAGYVDLDQAEYSVHLFAWTLLAHCRQTTQVIYNATGQSPGDIVSQPELWLLTMYGYNAGAGCLSQAVEEAYARDGVLNMENVGSLAKESCSGGWGYVQNIIWHASYQKENGVVTKR